MRADTLAALLLLGLALPMASAAASAEGAAAVLPDPAALLEASPVAVRPANPASEPAAQPDITGASVIVARAAQHVATGAGGAELESIAREQQLVASLRPLKPTSWTLGRFLPPMAALPSASLVAPSPVEGPLGAPARAAVTAIAMAGVASLALPKLPLLPLYSRIQREEAMLNARRSQLYEVVRAEPGIHLSDLVRRSGLGWGAALYHLSVLEKSRVLVAHNEGGFKRYFANGVHHRAEQTRLVALRHEAAKALFEAVQAMPGRSGRELATALQLSPSTLARASDRLEDAGLVKRMRAGRRVLYFPAEPVASAAPPMPVAA